jgi:hypothetical protein
MMQWSKEKGQNMIYITENQISRNNSPWQIELYGQEINIAIVSSKETKHI